MYYVIVQSSQYNKHTFSFEKKKDAIDFVADQFEIRLKLFSEKKTKFAMFFQNGHMLLYWIIFKNIILRSE